MTRWLPWVLLAGPLWAADPPLSCSLVPGWTQHGEARSYNADNLFEYMDGNAEGYIVYGFQKMRGISCQQNGVTLLIDISDMGDTDSAYGIYTANRDVRQPAESIGMGGQIVPRRAIFAKGSFYVEVGANPEGDHSAALRAWTAALAKLVPGSTALPPALAWFPQSEQSGLRLIPESLLGLRLLRRGYAGKYDAGKAFVALEDTPASAAAVMEKLRARFASTEPAKVAEEAFQFTDKYLGRLCFFRKGRYIGGWANVVEGQDPVALATALAGKVP